MKKIIDTKNIVVNEVEESDMEKWIKEDFQNTHPLNIVKATFPENVMDIISSDHHKSKDYGLSINYDHASEEWYISHHGYIRDNIVGEGKTYLDAADDYMSKIRRANERVVYGEIEMQANKHLPENLSVEIGEDVITLFDYSDGYDATKTIAFRKLEDKSIGEIIKVVEELVAGIDKI